MIFVGQKSHKSGIVDMVHPTPIYLVDEIFDFSSVQNEIKNCINDVSFDFVPENWGKTTNVTYLNEDIIDKQKLNNFNKSFNKHLKEYCEFLNFDFKKYSRESWLSKNNFGNHTHMHCHNTADIVATYYYETNENDGDLIIQPPQFLETSLCFQQERYLYKPKKGRLIFFPGFLYHGVKTNTTNNERISMSMSIYFER